MLNLGTPLKAFIVRLLFIIHAIVSVWRVVVERDDGIYWCLLLVPFTLVVEGCLTLKFSKKGEWQSFRPCIVLYIASVVPCIWILESDVFKNRTSINKENVSVCILDTKDKQAVESYSKNKTTTIGGIEVHIPELSSDGWFKVLQQALLFLLIVGRWLLPRAGVSHNKLSNILLVQIAMAADSLDFLAAGLRAEEVLCLPVVLYGTLALWTWSLAPMPFLWDTDEFKNLSLRIQSSKKIGILQRFNSEVWEIFSIIFMQDGPFLCMRLYFACYLSISSQGLLFFIAKNILVLLLRTYRLVALLCLDEQSTMMQKFKLLLQISPPTASDQQEKDDNEVEVVVEAKMRPPDDEEKENTAEDDVEKGDNQIKMVIADEMLVPNENESEEEDNLVQRPQPDVEDVSPTTKEV